MQIKRGKLDIILNVMCIVVLVSMTIFLITVWSKIPEKIPMHYDFSGNIDRWGTKAEIIILPIIAWSMYAFITTIEKFPQVWNTGVTVTEENKEQVYLILLHLVSTIKFIIVCVFTYIIIQSVIFFKLSIWFIPAFLIILFGNLFYWIWKLFKVK